MQQVFSEVYLWQQICPSQYFFQSSFHLSNYEREKCSHHFLHNGVYQLFSVSEGTEALGERVSFDFKSTEWG